MKQLLFAATFAVFISVSANGQTPNQDGKNQDGKKKNQDWKNEGVLYLDHSLNARLHPVPVQAVHLGDGFWAGRRKVTTERSLPTMLDLLEEHGVVDNFRRLSSGKNVPRKGPVYTDSDLYKWIEAASWAIASNETADADKRKLRSEIESLVPISLAPRSQAAI